MMHRLAHAIGFHGRSLLAGISITAIAGFLLVVINMPTLCAQTLGVGPQTKRSDQASRPSFEAVSIKPESSTGMAYFNSDPGYDFMRGVSADLLVGRAYNLPLFQIVLDQTNLTGRYDITLDWTPDPGQSAAPGIPVPLPEANGPSLQTALKETLGLKLVSAKVPMDTIVIDHIKEPSPN
jgi:hypothetical protein